MPRKLCTLVLGSAALLVCAGCARAQQPASPGPAVTVRSDGSAAPAAQPRGYTGFTIRFSGAMSRAGEVAGGHPVVEAVHPGSPAHKAGLRPGDVLLEIGGRDTRENGAMRVQPGGRYTYRIRRGQEEREVTLVAVPRPAELDTPRP